MDDHTDPAPEPSAGPAAPPPAPPVPTPARSELPPARCTPSFEELYRYMDGQLDEGRNAFIRSHLDACGGCGELYELQTQFRRLIELRCQSELPSDLRDKVFGAISELELGPEGRSSSSPDRSR